ncbi:hypothetical protein P9112_003218 [Eukaryota sp. TZLM1-RC]
MAWDHELLTPTVTSSVSKLGTDAFVSLTLPNDLLRTPTTFVFVCDISGSMGSLASIPDPESGEIDGFTRLDLVRHTLHTAVEVMNEQDSVALVSFHTNADVVVPFTNISDGTKADIKTKIDQLRPRGSTNIWLGLKKGYDICIEAHRQSPNSQICLLLLSDGAETCSPPSGLFNTVSKMVSKTPNIATLSCIGFGYDLDIQHLLRIANHCNGIYGFIPDASMVGTVFINYLCNALATHIWGCNVVLIIYDSNAESEVRLEQSVPFLQGGIAKNVAFKLPSDSSHILNISVIDPRTEATLLNVDDPETNDAAAVQKHRISLVECLESLHNDPSRNPEVVNQVAQSLKNSPEADDPLVQGFIGDLEGEVVKAVEQDNFERWGQYYLPALAGAHRLQYCANFRDPGVQLYASPLFNEIKSVADEIFCNLEPPEPSAASYARMLTVQPRNSRSPQAVHSMPRQPRRQPTHSTNFNFGMSPMVLGAPSDDCEHTAPPVFPSFGQMPLQCRSSMPDIINVICDEDSDEDCVMQCTAPNTEASRSRSMRSYYDTSGVCFAGECLVDTANGLKRVDELKKGSVLSNGSTVVCVVKSVCKKQTELVSIGELMITPYHPLLIDGDWKFPIGIAESKVMDVDYVYNFVLDSNHTMTVSGFECVTLGHGLFVNEVVSHEYFGDRVVDDLRSMRGFENGIVSVEGVERNVSDGRICGLVTI